VVTLFGAGAITLGKELGAEAGSAEAALEAVASVEAADSAAVEEGLAGVARRGRLVR